MNKDGLLIVPSEKANQNDDKHNLIRLLYTDSRHYMLPLDEQSSAKEEKTKARTFLSTVTKCAARKWKDTRDVWFFGSAANKPEPKRNLLVAAKLPRTPSDPTPKSGPKLSQTPSDPTSESGPKPWSPLSVAAAESPSHPEMRHTFRHQRLTQVTASRTLSCSRKLSRHRGGVLHQVRKDTGHAQELLQVTGGDR